MALVSGSWCLCMVIVGMGVVVERHFVVVEPWGQTNLQMEWGSDAQLHKDHTSACIFLKGRK